MSEAVDRAADRRDAYGELAGCLNRATRIVEELKDREHFDRETLRELAREAESQAVEMDEVYERELKTWRAAEGYGEPLHR
ncbi:MAG: hypothetical protein AB9880_00110 [Christensenellales bacterium]